MGMTLLSTLHVMVCILNVVFFFSPLLDRNALSDSLCKMFSFIFNMDLINNLKMPNTDLRISLNDIMRSISLTCV